MGKPQRKAQAKLARRIKSYEETGTKPRHQRHKPGSLNPKKG